MYQVTRITDLQYLESKLAVSGTCFPKVPLGDVYKLTVHKLRNSESDVIAEMIVDVVSDQNIIRVWAVQDTHGSLYYTYMGSLTTLDIEVNNITFKPVTYKTYRKVQYFMSRFRTEYQRKVRNAAFQHIVNLYH